MPLWMIAAEWAARIILVLLIGLSVWSLSIIIDKKKFFKAFVFSQSDIKNFLNQQTQFQGPGILKALFEDFLSTKNPQQKEHIFNSHILLIKKEMESGLGILGTLGSTTPFIGLLGTVLGIIVAFGQLSMGQGDTNSVMFALAEALILTAVGLFVAIPAVVSFNTYNRKIKNILTEIESLKEYSLSKS